MQTNNTIEILVIKNEKLVVKENKESSRQIAAFKHNATKPFKTCWAYIFCKQNVLGRIYILNVKEISKGAENNTMICYRQQL